MPKFLLISILLFTSFVSAQVLTTEQKLADFAQINAAVDSNYGPLHYKQKTLGLNLAALREKYRTEITQTQNNAEFYYTLVRYVAEYQDGHFVAALPSDFKAELPIATDLVAGQVLIADIDRKRLSEKDFPFAKGDQIIALDGIPAADVVKDLARYLASGYSLSASRIAAQVIFIRSGRRLPVPTGDVAVTVRRGTSDIIETKKLKWIVTGTPLDERISLQSFNLPLQISGTRYNSLSMENNLVDIFGRDRLERSFQCSGSTRTSIPEDATIIMKTPFLAYYHPTPKGLVGYLRIPHYSFPKPEETLKQYEYAIRVLEEKTVGLIIDQDHNCGGSVGFLHAMVSLFISKPVKPAQFELLASKKEYFGFKAWLKEVVPDSIDMKEVERVLEVIKSAWERGDYLTAKTSISGDEWIYPNRFNYTKPIVMLIDELSGSGGDAFPALMGGNNRAVLLGTRTWGLGGHVGELPPLNYSALNVYITKSLFFRPDGVAIENNGVNPDVPYVMTREDFMYEYKNYQKFYIKTLLELVK